MVLYDITYKQKSQLGITLLEIIVAVGLLGAVMIGIVSLTNQMTEDTKANAAALHVKTVGYAANEYIQKNFAAVSGVATATNPALIKVSTMITDGQLPAGFSSQNVYGQETCVLVLQPTSNNLEAMVVTELGDTIPDLDLGQIVAGIGGDGGAIYSTSATSFTGTMGGWGFAFGNYAAANNLGQSCDGTAGTVTLAAGHPVMALWFADGSAISATLYRDQVVGNPSLNTMNTPILMGVTTVQVEGAACSPNGALARHSDGRVLSCVSGSWSRQGSMYWREPVGSYAALPLSDQAGTVRLTTDTNRAFAWDGGSWRALAVDQNGDLNVPNNLTVGNNITAGGTVTARSNITSVAGNINASVGNVTAGANVSGTNVLASNLVSTNFLQLNAIASAGSGCAPNGLLARDSTGGILSCKSGIWRAALMPAVSQYYYVDFHSTWHSVGLGVHTVCTSNGGNENNSDDTWRYVSGTPGGNWTATYKNAAIRVLCLDW